MVKNGKTILSGIDPAGRAEKTVDALSIKDRTLYFCPSPLYGYGLARLLSRLEKEAPASALLCVEADPELYDLSVSDIDSLILNNKKLHMTNIRNAEEICAVVRNIWGARIFRRIETVRLNGGWQLFAGLYDSICEQLRREIALQWSNVLTLNKLGRLYIRNVLRNLPLVNRFKSIACLSFGSSPVLVLGAGPSLDETLDWIEQRAADSAERRFKIVCVDTCLGALKDRGIVPDLAVILESQHWNLRDFIGCKGWEVKTAIDLSSLPSSAHLLKGETFLFMTPWTDLHVFERLKNAGLLPALIPPLGSVGLSAVELARRLTGGKIVVSGLDFSFSADKYHVRCAPGHRSKLNTQNRFRRILNTAAYDSYSASASSKSGETVYTSPSMKNYRSLFEQEFSGDARIFDIEGSGLPLGLKTLSKKDAIDLLNEEEFSSEPTRTGGSLANQRCDNELSLFQNSVSFGKDFRKTVLKDSFSFKSNVAFPKAEVLEKPQLTLFYFSEKKRLIELRDILTGEEPANKERLLGLLDECDYVWGHFPDYSGGRGPDAADISFLKRVRAELDPMLKLMDRALKEI